MYLHGLESSTVRHTNHKARRVLLVHRLLCADWLGFIHVCIFNVSNCMFFEIAGAFLSKKRLHTNEQICTHVKFRQCLLPHYRSGPLVLLLLAAQSTAVVCMGLKLGLDCHMRAKYRLKCSRRDRDREGSVTWCLGKRMGCRAWWKRSLGRSNGRWKGNIKMDVK